MSDDLKPYTKYVCPVGGGRLGHSSVWTGALLHPERTRSSCVCGEPFVEEASTADGHRYRLEFETIDPHQADAMERAHGRNVWQQLTSEEWAALSWHPSSREADVPGEIIQQHKALASWAETHEQPIRNVRLLKSAAASWSVLAGESPA